MSDKQSHMLIGLRLDFVLKDTSTNAQEMCMSFPIVRTKIKHALELSGRCFNPCG